MTAARGSGRLPPRRGGFAVGFVVGLLAGLAVALGVALYVSKVPVPFVNKVPQRTAEQDAAEAERNKGWDPNAGLTGKPATRPPAPAAAPTQPAPLGGPAARPPAVAASAGIPAATARPAAPASAATGADPLAYFAQAGAFARSDDADAQRAKLALQGFEAQVTEREQSGRTVYRVRVGPFNGRAEAERAVEQLKAAGVDAALVRVQKSP
jgi:cell division protein FtsN